MRSLTIGVIALVMVCASEGLAFGEGSGAPQPGAAHWKNICNESAATAGTERSSYARKSVASRGGANARSSCAAVHSPLHISNSAYLGAGLAGLAAVTIGVVATSPASP